MPPKPFGVVVGDFLEALVGNEARVLFELADRAFGLPLHLRLQALDRPLVGVPFALAAAVPSDSNSGWSGSMVGVKTL